MTFQIIIDLKMEHDPTLSFWKIDYIIDRSDTFSIGESGISMESFLC